MIKSKLATKTVDFGVKKSNTRTEKIVKITPHHMAGNIDAEQCAKMHRDSVVDASANYYIGTDGTICAGVSEDRRAWTSSSQWNDQRAITIEVANDSFEPNWTVSSKAYKSLVKLCADICTRYNITPHYDGTKYGSITYHQMFSYTACPGPYLKKLIDNGTFEKDILKEMKGATKPVSKPKKYSGGLPIVPPALRYGSAGLQVDRLQRFLNWYGNYGLIVDGVFGMKTKSAVLDFQEKVFYDEPSEWDGIFGSKSLAKAKKVKK